eukprot:TRINITY_DN9506_c0_g1_i1.p1 TRINITY_DN9506_c0_g1~~TRINITY_DN9506_c0_g1_i1.p1  ORF type:complete len:380 (-),score=86.44 TRINITY_DN9506_c0_g1_i1:9-1148(-)
MNIRPLPLKGFSPLLFGLQKGSQSQQIKGLVFHPFIQQKKNSTERKIINLAGVREDGKTMRWYKKVGIERETPSSVLKAKKHTPTAETANSEGKLEDKSPKDLQPSISANFFPSSIPAPPDATPPPLPPPKFFYKIKLDEKEVATPRDKLVLIPSMPLATAIAAEFEYQAKNIFLGTMPLTVMAVASTELTPDMRKDKIKKIIRYLNSDTILFRAGDDEPGLQQLQSAFHDPIIAWMEKFFDVKLKITIGDSNMIMVAPHQPKETFEKITHYLTTQLSDFQIVALEIAVSSLKSTAIALALMERVVNIEQALFASRAEEEQQIKDWGDLPDVHETDRAESLISLSSSSVFFSFEFSPIKLMASGAVSYTHLPLPTICSV